MTETLVGQQPTDSQELAKQVRSHPFVDGPTRKLVRSWIQHDPPPAQIPWTPLTKPLSRCRVALVSSAGIARHDQPPFDQDLERRDPWWSDQSWRPIPLDTSEADVAIYHLHIDPRFGHQDLDCVLPLRRLQELAADGLVGQVAATHYSFMGYIRRRDRAGWGRRALPRQPTWRLLLPCRSRDWRDRRPWPGRGDRIRLKPWTPWWLGVNRC
jgi:Glycine/sarcosine/betaine reductase selenoprotein B (GRDB)